MPSRVIRQVLRSLCLSSPNVFCLCSCTSDGTAAALRKTDLRSFCSEGCVSGCGGTHVNGETGICRLFFFCTALWISVTVKSPPPPPQLDRTFTSVPPLPGAQLKAKMNVGHTGSWGAETVGALLMCSFTVGQSFSTSEVRVDPLTSVFVLNAWDATVTLMLPHLGNTGNVWLWTYK